MNIPKIIEPPVLTVSELTYAIKNCLEKKFSDITLQGELSNCKLNTSGHLYFSLKDNDAQISAIMFRLNVASLKTIPKEGTQVIVRGEINVYPSIGKYQIIVRELKPVGLGELLLKLEELKIKLHKLGWFSKNRKRPIPKFPKIIGVVTSPTGAAIQDMLHILTRRFSGFHLILNPVKVQGEGAAKEIAQAIEQFNTYNLADVLIIGRGGGSIEDLWAFNEEIVAQAIFNSKIPIISAVGHETDHCIADYVADVRAPTPSAAAELVIAEKSQQIIYLGQLQKRMQTSILQLVRQYKQRLLGITRHPIFRTPYALLGQKIQKLDLLRQHLDDTIKQRLFTQKIILKSKKQELHSLNPQVKLKYFKQKLITLDKNLQTTINRRLQIDIIRLKYLKDSLDTVNPKNLLTKGYCILFSEKNFSAITSVSSVEPLQKVQIHLSDGKLSATINNILSEIK